MAIDIYDLSFFQDDSSEEEELTEEELRRLELERLGLSTEPEEESQEEEEEDIEYAPIIGDEEIADTKLSVEEPLDDSIYNLEFFQEDSEQENIEGKQLSYKGEADGIPFYYDEDTKNHVTAYTRGYQLDDGKVANFPSVLPSGKLVFDLSPKTEKALYNYWLKNDPSKIEYFKTIKEAELSAKFKSQRHNTLGKEKGIIVEGEELTGGEAFDFGTRLERHTIGNIFRLLQAGVSSITNDIEFTTAIKNIEKERKEVIFKELKEKYGKEFEGRENDGAVLAGRIATAFADPITFLLPWAKAAKLGKISALGFGAGVGVTDMAIYEYAAYGHVTPSSLLFAGSIGGLSSLGGKMIGDRFIASREKTIDLGNIGLNGEKVIKPISKQVDEPRKILPLNEATDLDEATTTIASVLKPLLDELGLAPKVQKIVIDNKKVIETFKQVEYDYNNLLKLGERTKKGNLKKGKNIQEFEKSINKYLWESPLIQAIQSADTSINVGKMAAAFKKLDTAGVWKKGKINLDIGGGRFDNATDFLKGKKVTNYIYDPFNRAAEHNTKVAAKAANSQSDTVTVNNVLNVIKEEGNQLRVIKQAANAVKPNGKVYISVYEGSGKLKGTGKGTETTKGWQNNKSLKEYLPLVQSEFKDVTIKNGIIEASKPLYQFNKMTKQKANQAIAEMVNPDGSLKYGGVTYKVLKRERDKASKWINNEHPEIVQRMADGRVEIIDGMIRELGQNDKLTRNLLSTILYEGIKPAFGAGIGAAVGAFLTDPDDEESNLAMNLAIGGFTLGLLQKRLQANPYIKGDMKEKAFGILENQGAIALHNFLKIHTSGTMASKLSAYGGPLETLSKLLFHQQMGSTRGILGAEHAADVLELKFFQTINEKVIQQASPELYNPAWRIIRGLESETDAIRRLNLNDLDQKNLKQLIKNTEEFRKTFSDTYVRGANIHYKEIENYGLPQIYNQMIKTNEGEFQRVLRQAVKIEFGVKDKKANKIAKDIFETMTGKNSDKLFDESSNFLGVPILKHFHKQRQFNNPEAIKVLEPFLETNINTILKKWVSSTVKGVEFGRAMGFRNTGRVDPKTGAPILRYDALRSIKKSLDDQLDIGQLTYKQHKEQVEQFRRGINSYFGVHGSSEVFGGQHGKNLMALITFLGNTTMLTRSSIAQLGDIIQPFQNSGQWSAVKALARKAKTGRDFSIESGMHYRSSYEHDRLALFSALDPENIFQQTLGNLNQKFFKYNLMSPLTDWSQRFAFNTGIIEAFSIAKKYSGKALSPKLREKVNQMGLKDNDLVNLSKFKTVDDAFDDALGQRILARAGNKINKRDVGVPSSGNRLAFAQNRNPYVRSLGMFLSWSQYKTTQMNALLQRVENGDVALAMKMALGITVFGGLRELQIATSPAREYYKDNEPDNWSPKWWQEAATLSGNIPWTVEKIARFWGDYSSPLENAIGPASTAFIRTMNAFKNVPKNLAAKDYEGAVVSAIKPLPLGRDFNNIINRIGEWTGEDWLQLEDEPNTPKGKQRGRRRRSRRKDFEGGAISKDHPVPNAPLIPMERKDRLGTQSYAVQASAEPINPFTGEPYTAIYKR